MTQTHFMIMIPNPSSGFKYAWIKELDFTEPSLTDYIIDTQRRLDQFLDFNGHTVSDLRLINDDIAFDGINLIEDRETMINLLEDFTS